MRGFHPLGLGLGLNFRGMKLNAASGFTGLLDTYPGAAAAYSLQALSSSFQNSDVIFARRSSDNAELGFTATEITDGTLTTWAGAGDAFVKTWYDQSGNGRNATQPTAANQPKIVSSGALVTGGLDFDGTNSRMDIDGYAPISTSYYFAGVFNFDVSPTSLKTVFDSTNLTSGGFAIVAGNTANKFTPYGYFNGIVTARVLTSTSNLTLNDSVYSALFKSAGSKSYINSVEEGSIATAWTTAGTNSFTKSTIGYDQSTSGRDFDGQIREMIIYEVDQSSNRAAIEAEINSRYSIY